MMKFRVILPDGNIRKLECEVGSVRELYDAVRDNVCDVPQSFIMHHFDSDFNDYFSLECDDDIRDLMTLKIVPSATSAPSEAGPSSSAASSVTEPDSEVEGRSTSLSSRKKNIKSAYSLPRFDADLEMMLQKAHGSVKPPSHGEKSRILTRLCADIYENYTAYPSSSELEIVANAFVEKYPGVKDTGKGYESWTNSLMFKMGNYRGDMRKRGSLEMSMHSGKRSKYHPELPSARKGFKKAKGGVINWQPEYPDGEDEKSLQQHKTDIRNEIGKGSPDQSLIKKKMSLTFALRRKEVNSNMRISDVKDNWPALFDMKEVCAIISAVTFSAWYADISSDNFIYHNTKCLTLCYLHCVQLHMVTSTLESTRICAAEMAVRYADLSACLRAGGTPRRARRPAGASITGQTDRQTDRQSATHNAAPSYGGGPHNNH